MVQTKGHKDSYLKPVGNIYKREIIMKRKYLCGPDQKIKREVESKKKK
jgi:hypothetical protein